MLLDVSSRCFFDAAYSDGSNPSPTESNGNRCQGTDNIIIVMLLSPIPGLYALSGHGALVDKEGKRMMVLLAWSILETILLTRTPLPKSPSFTAFGNYGQFLLRAARCSVAKEVPLHPLSALSSTVRAVMKPCITFINIHTYSAFIPMREAEEGFSGGRSQGKMKKNLDLLSGKYVNMCCVVEWSPSGRSGRVEAP